MSFSKSTLHTLYGQYRTPSAISRAVNADYIPLEADRSINSVHPIPIDWLCEELLPRERDRVREHFTSLLSSDQPQVPAFVEALQGTMANLNTVNNMGTAAVGIPARRSGGDAIDRLTDELDALTTGQAHSPSRNVRFAETTQTERVSRDHRVPGPYSPQPSSPTPRSILRSPGHSRSSSANAIVGFGASLERDARARSPTAGYSNELDVLDVQLDEIHEAVNGQLRIDDHDILERRNSNVAQARSMIRRLRGLRHLTEVDIDTVRAAVQSVMTEVRRDEIVAATGDISPDGRLWPTNRELSRSSRGARRSRPRSGAPTTSASGFVWRLHRNVSVCMLIPADCSQFGGHLPLTLKPETAWSVLTAVYAAGAPRADG